MLSIFWLDFDGFLHHGKPPWLRASFELSATFSHRFQSFSIVDFMAESMDAVVDLHSYVVTLLSSWFERASFFRVLVWVSTMFYDL